MVESRLFCYKFYVTFILLNVIKYNFFKYLIAQKAQTEQGEKKKTNIPEAPS